MACKEHGRHQPVDPCHGSLSASSISPCALPAPSTKASQYMDSHERGLPSPLHVFCQLPHVCYPCLHAYFQAAIYMQCMVQQSAAFCLKATSL